MTDGILATMTGIGTGIWAGILQNALDIVILAIITSIVVPLLRWLLGLFLKYLYKKGIISEKHLSLFQSEEEKFFLDFLMKELEKAKRQRNDEMIKMLEEEIGKIIKEKKKEK